MPTLTQECAEAIDAALFETGFEALGNTDGGATDWWHRGDRASTKQLRVQVKRNSLEFVIVDCDWPAVIDGVLGSGHTTFTIPCGGSATRDVVIDSSVEVVSKILELFIDVCQGVAVPSPTTKDDE